MFVLDEKQPRFVDLPAYGPASSRIHVARRIRLSGQTDAAVEETVTLEGYQAAFLRELFRNVPAANRAAMLQEELAPIGGAMQVQSVEIENLSQRDKPLVFKAAYLVRNNFKPAEGGLAGPIAGSVGADVFGSAIGAAAAHAVRHRISATVFQRGRVWRLPRGIGCNRWPPAMNMAKTRFVSWKVRIKPVDSGEHIQYELQLPAGRYSAADYAAYDNDLDRALAVLSPSVALKKTR